MSQNIKLACFLLILPFLAALGHDVYVNYLSDPEKTAEVSQQLQSLRFDAEGFQLSDLGYLVVNYTPSLYDNLKESVGQENWTRRVDPVLQQYTILIALIPAAIFYLYLMLARVTHLPPFRDVSGSTFKTKNSQPKDGQFKYKRR